LYIYNWLKKQSFTSEVCRVRLVEKDAYLNETIWELIHNVKCVVKWGDLKNED